MNARAIAAARESFERARDAAAKTVTGEGHAALTAHWASFLVNANRVFTKLEQGAKAGPVKAWWDGIKRIRKEDELLRYIQHARNADEHGIRQITPRIPAMPIGYSFEPKGVRRLVAPETTLMVAVCDRGKRYDPPTSHLGQPLNIMRPNLNDLPTFMALELNSIERPEPFRDIANLTISYLAKLIDDADKFVVD